MVGATAGKIGTVVPSWRLSAWMHVYIAKILVVCSCVIQRNNTEPALRVELGFEYHSFSFPLFINSKFPKYTGGSPIASQ